MPNDNTTKKITFKVRQRDETQYKLPPGLEIGKNHQSGSFLQKHDELKKEQAAAVSEKSESSTQKLDVDNSNNLDAIRRLEEYDKAAAAAKIRADSAKIRTFEARSASTILKHFLFPGLLILIF